MEAITKMANNSSQSTTAMKPLEFAKVLKLVVLFSILAVSCTLVYFASFDNNFVQYLPSLGFSSIYRTNATLASNSSSSTDLDDYEPVHDEYYELRKALRAASTEDKTVILTTLNDAWAEPNSVFDLFLASLRTGNNTARLVNHLLVIAVDDKAYSRCQATVPHCYYFKSNHSSEMASEAKFMTPIYMEMMWARLAFLQTILSLGYSFVFTDTDVMWLRDPFPHFFPDWDFQTSSDLYNGNPLDLDNLPNNGFLYVKSNNRTVEFYKFWVASRRRFPSLHEQNVFNRIKYEPFVKEIGLKLRFLDTDYFGGFCVPSKDFYKVCTMHANCCVGLDKKIADLNATLEDFKRFSLSPSNETAHWRAPQRCKSR